MIHENDMTFKFQCLKIKFYWNTVTFILFFIFCPLVLSVQQFLHYDDRAEELWQKSDGCKS